MPSMREALRSEMATAIIDRQPRDAIDTVLDLTVDALQQGLLTVARRLRKGLAKPPRAPYVTPDAVMFWSDGWRAGCTHAQGMLVEMAQEVVKQ